MTRQKPRPRQAPETTRNFTGFSKGDAVRLSQEAIGKLVSPRDVGRFGKVTGGTGQIVGLTWPDGRADAYHADFLEQVQ